MRDWFRGLQPRERVILLGGAAAAAVIVIWMFVLRPIDRESAGLRETVAAQQRLLVDLARLDGSGSAASSPAGSSDGQTLMILITNTAQQNGLTLPRTRPDGADAINVTFQNASFDSLLSWLIMLETTHNVVVETASFSSSREPGLVSGQIFLRRS